ncbi:hypothetical protein AB1Y20_005342 [Prymnesium parvum]|uniref:Swiss Army Knife 2H phosphoesterase domain-containing protein n=1 Tax=Prymnesium parvum TaxID=97485 RepID=A0AB34J690_PRYPA
MPAPPSHELHTPSPVALHPQTRPWMAAHIVRGSLVVHGAAVDAAAAPWLPSVPAAAAAARVQRDGAHLHLTLLHKGALPARAEARAALVEAANTRLCRDGQLIAGIGAGEQREEGRSCQFVVVLWPEAEAFCNEYRQPGEHVDLHITLGFEGEDLHRVRKGPRQMAPVVNQPLALPSWTADAEGWVAIDALLSEAVDACRRASRREAARAPCVEERIVDLLAIADRLVLYTHAAGCQPPQFVYARLHSSRCKLLGKLGREQEALDDAVAALQCVPRHAKLMVVAGEASFCLGQYDAAMRWWRRALAVEGDGALCPATDVGGQGLSQRTSVERRIDHCARRISRERNEAKPLYSNL